MGPALKFGDAAKVIYLETLRKFGQRASAAEVAGVSLQCVANHRKDDKEFAAAEELALKLRAEGIVQRLESEAVHGFFEPLFDKKGNAILVKDHEGNLVQATHRKVETTLRAMVLKRYAHEYREVSEVNHKHQGGVMVMPAPVSSVADWAKLVATVNKTEKEEA
jgi:hypothetical protein